MDIQVYCAHSRMVDIEAMVENPRNPNKHSDKQISLLAKIIKSQGWRNPIVVSNRSGFIVKGHCRLAAARLLGVESVPVDYQDYETEAAEWADMIADNRIAELAVSDDKELRALLSELEGQIDLELTGFSGVSLEDLLSEPEVIDEEAEAEKVKMQKLELTERMDKAKYVFWAFSGGRDSTVGKFLNDLTAKATGKEVIRTRIVSAVDGMQGFDTEADYLLFDDSGTGFHAAEKIGEIPLYLIGALGHYPAENRNIFQQFPAEFFILFPVVVFKRRHRAKISQRS